jgi:plastocyanin
MVIKILFATIAVLAVGISACGDDDDDETEDADEATAEATEGASGGDSDDTSGAPGEVTIQDFAFAPGDLEVSVGDTVTWTNLDSTSHTVTDDTGAFASGSIAGEATFEFTFEAAGEFAYHCDFHPGMTGTVTVSEGASAPASDDGGQPVRLGDGY